ncbi:hypothetical protein [Streptomyces sp. NPDC051567]|uniref:hypothetical protein n=1 Tax=Streptomyces sp. NPDC051567 TaxID=3365660 RepID=UPI0037B61CCC
MDTAGVGGRVYGSERDDPYPYRVAGREYRELCGGALDGQWADVTGWSAGELGAGAALITEDGSWGPGGRAVYGPVEEDPDGVWHWEGDVP